MMPASTPNPRPQSLHNNCQQHLAVHAAAMRAAACGNEGLQEMPASQHPPQTLNPKAVRKCQPAPTSNPKPQTPKPSAAPCGARRSRWLAAGHTLRAPETGVACVCTHMCIHLGAPPALRRPYAAHRVRFCSRRGPGPHPPSPAPNPASDSNPRELREQLEELGLLGLEPAGGRGLGGPAGRQVVMTMISHRARMRLSPSSRLSQSAKI